MMYIQRYLMLCVVCLLSDSRGYISRRYLQGARHFFAARNRASVTDQHLGHDNCLLPIDAQCHHYLHSPDWQYWFRRGGMQTSTDDVLVSFLASLPSSSALVLADQEARVVDVSDTIAQGVRRSVDQYVDLGCGIGSILLLVAHKLQPSVLSLGIEVQEESANIAKHTLSHLPKDAPNLAVENMDLRDLATSSAMQKFVLEGRCDLITGNPPYCPVGTGTLAKDSQKINARFEFHGGIEEYCQTVKVLLSPEGKFVFSFWSNGHDRVLQALKKASLAPTSMMKVIGGKADNPKPYLHVYEATHADPSSSFVEVDLQCFVLDITRHPQTNKLHPSYYQIQEYLQMCPRPLK